MEIWKRLQNGEKAPKCAEDFGISVHIVRSIKYGKRWTHVTGLENKRKRGAKRESSSPTTITASSAFDDDEFTTAGGLSAETNDPVHEPKKLKLVRCLLPEFQEPAPIAASEWLDTANEMELSVISLLSSRFSSHVGPAPLPLLRQAFGLSM